MFWLNDIRCVVAGGDYDEILLAVDGVMIVDCDNDSGIVVCCCCCSRLRSQLNLDALWSTFHANCPLSPMLSSNNRTITNKTKVTLTWLPVAVVVASSSRTFLVVRSFSSLSFA